MNELKCMLLNASPYGPQNENGTGANTRMQYIPLDKEKKKNTDKSFGYYVDYSVIWDKSQKNWFDYIKQNDLILSPVSISYTMDIDRHCIINSIKKI